MERRSEPRIPTYEAVKVNLLDMEEGAASYHGHIVELSGRGLRLAVPHAIPVNTVISVESADCLYLGDVAFCTSVEDAWHVGMMVSERLRDTLDLTRLRRALGHSRAPAAQGAK